ncbi:MAG: DUF4178 domain-containing protein [Bacteroidales bacterium]|nr:DUF4178 domain-containing protein [Bacteroidales bacterium]
MSIRVTCPGCGGAVVFTVGTGAVSVCPYCRSVVARSDRGVENLGKVADLIDTGTVLKVGLTGQYEDQTFQLTGRTQLRHAAGGVWDEWYATFADGRWGWLAEAHGQYYLTFEQPSDATRLPAFDDIDPGTIIIVNGQSFTVAEKGSAEVLAAEGEIPYPIAPGVRYPYADLSGLGDAFATLDYSESPPTVYVGREQTLDALQIRVSKQVAPHELREVGGTKVECPNCGGALALQAPDQSQRVFCPYCGSMLECDHGKLALLQKLQAPEFPIAIPVGSVGQFPNGQRIVAGVFHRSVTFDRKYYWQEYLLYDAASTGFEWLVCSDNHWTRLKSVPAGDVTVHLLYARYDGMSFRRFQNATATLKGIVGECYWPATVGEQTETADFIHPPYLLSQETAQYDSTKEVNYSFGAYLTPTEVATAFQLSEPLPRPIGVGPNQPFPYCGIYRIAGFMFAAITLLGLMSCSLLPDRVVAQHHFTVPARPRVIPPVIGSTTPKTPTPTPAQSNVFFTDLFHIHASENIYIAATAPELSNSWLVVEGDLIQQETGRVQPFVAPLSYYFGTDDGESWSEGSRSHSLYLTAQPPGQYSLRLDVEREKDDTPTTLSVEVRQGVPHASHWFLALLTLAILPILVGIYHRLFSHWRWKDSDFSPYASSE